MEQCVINARVTADSNLSSLTPEDFLNATPTEMKVEKSKLDIKGREIYPGDLPLLIPLQRSEELFPWEITISRVVDDYSTGRFVRKIQVHVRDKKQTLKVKYFLSLPDRI